MDFLYYHKQNNNCYGLKEVERITRIILLEIFERANECNDIKSSTIFEFMLIYKNSANNFQRWFNCEELFNWSEKEFFEICTKKTENIWVVLNNNEEVNNNDEGNIIILLKKIIQIITL